MKSERRHELTTNELADWMGHIPDFLRKNATTIIGVVLIVAAVVLYFFGKTLKENTNTAQQIEVSEQIARASQSRMMMALQGQQQDMEFSNALLIEANKLGISAEQADNPLLAALALIKQGQALRADLHYRTADVSDEIVKDQIEQAKRAYTLAIEKATGHNTLTAMARYGLGLCAEEIGEFDNAIQIYSAIAAEPVFANTIYPARANARMAAMDENREVFILVDAPEPVEEETPPAESFDEEAAEIIEIEEGAAETAEEATEEAVEETVEKQAEPAVEAETD